MFASQAYGFHRRRHGDDKWGWIIISVTCEREARPRPYFSWFEASVHSKWVLAFEQGGIVCWSIKEDYVYLRWMYSKRVSWMRLIAQDIKFIKIPPKCNVIWERYIGGRHKERYCWVCYQVFKLRECESGIPNAWRFSLEYRVSQFEVGDD